MANFDKWEVFYKSDNKREIKEPWRSKSQKAQKPHKDKAKSQIIERQGQQMTKEI